MSVAHAPVAEGVGDSRLTKGLMQARVTFGESRRHVVCCCTNSDLAGVPGGGGVRAVGRLFNSLLLGTKRNRRHGGFLVAAPLGRAAVALLLLLTTTPASAFRTAGDLDEFSGSPVVHFPRGIPFEISSSAPFPSTLTFAQIESAALEASFAWAEPDCSAGPLNYVGPTQRTARPGDGFNTIQWIHEWPTQEVSPDAAAYTDVQYLRLASGDWTIEEADLYLDDRAAWTASGIAGARDLQSILLHEMGHMLGLLHPCEPDGGAGAPSCSGRYATAAMYPLYSDGRLSLSADDSEGVCFLYPKSGCNEASCTTGTVCVDDACVPSCLGEVCLAGQSCTVNGCEDARGCDGVGCVATSCDSGQDCALGEHCNENICARGITIAGDPCTSDSECFDGVCQQDRCVQACATNADCESGAVCNALSEGRAACVGPQGALGATCKDAGDCLGGQCLTGAARTPICTRLCGGTAPECPNGWACDNADGKAVCAPDDIRAAGGGGCSVSIASRRSTLVNYGWLWVVAGCWLRRSRLRLGSSAKENT